MAGNTKVLGKGLAKKAADKMKKRPKKINDAVIKALGKKKK